MTGKTKVVDLTAKVKATVGAVLKDDSTVETDVKETVETKVVNGTAKVNATARVEQFSKKIF